MRLSNRSGCPIAAGINGFGPGSLHRGQNLAVAPWSALKLADRSDFEGKKIAVVLPDTGKRYISSSLFG